MSDECNDTNTLYRPLYSGAEQTKHKKKITFTDSARKAKSKWAVIAWLYVIKTDIRSNSYFSKVMTTVEVVVTDTAYLSPLSLSASTSLILQAVVNGNGLSVVRGKWTKAYMDERIKWMKCLQWSYKISVSFQFKYFSFIFSVFSSFA